MGNIISYLEEYDKHSFKNMAFNEVDALVLSQFSYLKLDDLIPKIVDDESPVSFLTLAGHMDERIVFSDERYEKDNRLLFEHMLKSRRFSNMSFNYYTNLINEQVETQFCAMVCFLEDSIPIIIFRGTDENFVGWREDFNMAFKKPVTGQYLAKMYLAKVGEHIASDFMIGGHSKGGNLAVYSSMNTESDIRKRIRSIYSFDGPGFRPEILKSDDYDSISDRIHKYIPGSSVVGMLLEEHENYRVVESSSFGLLQHNPYTWKVNGHSFIERDSLDKSSLFMNKALNEWLLTLDEEQLEVFGETLFYILEGCEMKNMIEVSRDWKKGINNMIHASKAVDEETRDKINQILRILGEIIRENAKEDFDKKKEEIKGNLRDNLIRRQN